MSVFVCRLIRFFYISMSFLSFLHRPKCVTAEYCMKSVLQSIALVLFLCHFNGFVCFAITYTIRTSSIYRTPDTRVRPFFIKRNSIPKKLRMLFLGSIQYSGEFFLYRNENKNTFFIIRFIFYIFPLRKQNTTVYNFSWTVWSDLSINFPKVLKKPTILNIPTSAGNAFKILYFFAKDPSNILSYECTNARACPTFVHTHSLMPFASVWFVTI